MINHKHNNSREVAEISPDPAWLVAVLFASYLPQRVVAAATAVSAAVAAVTTGQC